MTNISLILADMSGFTNFCRDMVFKFFKYFEVTGMKPNYLGR